MHTASASCKTICTPILTTLSPPPQSNFFAALDSSDDESPAPKITQKKTTKPKAVAAKKEIVEPSKKAPGPKDRKDGKEQHGRPTRDNTKAKGGREFDRKSGTGRGKEVSKGGAGGNNWGSDKNAAEDGAAAAATAAAADNAAEGEDAAPREPREPEVPTFSYDEFLAKKKADAATGEGFSGLKIKEVESEFNVAAVQKDESDFLVMGTGKGLRKKAAQGKEKTVLEAGFRFKAPERDGDDDRGGRGGRGGGRGDRDGGRGGRGGRGERRAEPGVGKSFAEGGRGSRGGDDRRAPGAGRGAGGRGAGGRGVNVDSVEMFPALG